MKNLILIAVFLVTAWAGQAVYAQQGFGTNAPDKSAAVDIVSTKRGFLMPRIALTATNVATPVATPHHALMVYNTATAGTAPDNVTPGFYYWSVTGFSSTNPTATTSTHGAGKWVRVVDADDITATTVSAGDGIAVTPTDNPDGSTDYKVSMVAGDATDKYMVTIEDPANPGEFITSWVDKGEFLTDLLDVENGLTFDPATGSLKLGGALTENTTISTAENDLIFSVEADGAIKITGPGLETMDPTAIPAGATVAVMLADGTLQKYDLATLIADLEFEANNGLHRDATTGDVRLGGALIEPTVIATGTDGDGNALPANTLAITGLTAAAAANEIVVATDGSGILRTVKRSISAEVTSSGTVGGTGIGETEYNPYVQEVNLAVTLGGSDINLTLPATAAEGQVINIKIMNDDEDHAGYLNIISGGTTLTYGALPYQGWILKSNGTNWTIVGRN